ncbi:MAG TPA: serine/threonine-protein kinase [Chiayiivirga sp.]|nr:serine/threonine-protein kinase [Chiayiivirga sp.]
MNRVALPQIPGFRLVRKLGEGASGTVYQAIELEDEREVALKLFEPIDGPDVALPEDIEHERRVAASLRHRNLARVHAMGAYGGQHWLASEYLPGGTLADRIAKPMPVPRALEILGDLSRGLAHAHARGVVHGDVKPSNVLFRGARGTGDAVLVDFGTAVLMRAHHRRAVGGTPGYMSPEQARGEALDARADLYSLGCVLRDMLAGRPSEPAVGSDGPVEGVSLPVQTLPVSAHWLQPLVDALTAHPRDDRPADARAVLSMLATLVEASPEASRVLPATPSATALPRIHGVPEVARPRLWPWLVLGLLVLVAAFLSQLTPL